MWHRDSWLPRRSAEQRILRIGRHQVECWSDSDSGWIRQTAVPLPQSESGTPPALDALAIALQASLENITATQLTVVMESFWMPVSILTTGRKAWSTTQLETMGQHRLRDVHGALNGAWRVQVHHVAGQDHALVFGCPSAVLDSIANVRTDKGVTLHSLQPAFAWAWNRYRRPFWQPFDGWWVCLEQDRAVGCWIHHRRIEALHPALEAPSSPTQMAEHLAREALRSGIVAPDPHITMMAWERPVGAPGMLESSRHRWVALTEEPV